MDKNISSSFFDAYIFDLDGTLYSQKKLHIFVAFEMIRYYIRHVNRVLDLCIVFQFRRLREKEEYKRCTIDELLEVVAEKRCIEKEYVRTVINRWLFEKPLPLITKCAYNDVLWFITQVIDNGSKVAIYSDYPAMDKLQALNVIPDYVFSAEDEGIQELKPSKKAMRYILAQMDVSVDSCVYIGDRDSRDGQSAEYAGVTYFDIHAFKNHIKGILPTEKGGVCHD